MIVILHRAHLFREQSTGAILCALVALLDNHVAFCFDIDGGETDIAHPVALHAHHQLKTVRGNTLIVGCVIIASERVVVATVGGNDGRELTRF